MFIYINFERGYNSVRHCDQNTKLALKMINSHRAFGLSLWPPTQSQQCARFGHTVLLFFLRSPTIKRFRRSISHINIPSHLFSVSFIFFFCFCRFGFRISNAECLIQSLFIHKSLPLQKRDGNHH